MANIQPFRGVRPQDALAAEIIAPPYDVLSESEARVIVGKNNKSFLRVTRSEVDLPEGVDTHSKAVYDKARENLDAYLASGWLVQDDAPHFYLYRQTWRGRTQIGLMAACSVAEYDSGTIKKHELTRPDKEQDRVDNMQTLDAQPGLVFLAYRDNIQAIKDAMAEAAALPPAWRVTTEDDVEHALTPVGDPELVARLQAGFEQAPALYIADGHHRSAAASRVCAARSGAGESARFLAGIFPDSEVEILAYNRVVKDLGEHTPESLIAKIAEHFEIALGAAPEPDERGQWTMYLDGNWYSMRAYEGVTPEDPVGRLDIAVLQDLILAPLLGIEDPRTDTRIDFVGGIRGHEALSQAVDSGRGAVAFHLFPTGLDQLFDVADADMLMPPKSTWFEPKLRGGVVLHKI